MVVSFRVVIREMREFLFDDFYFYNEFFGNINGWICESGALERIKMFENRKKCSDRVFRECGKVS